MITQETQEKTTGKTSEKKINFDLKPRELVAFLDQYIIRQDMAKSVLATKICTHFNRIKHLETCEDHPPEFIGGIKSNILMMGPTGVGKTYMVKLIAKKLGVPFVKGDATKFSETGYVGKDVEDLIRDLVHEAGDDIELAEYGIVYIDEIDKIAAGRDLIGTDVSRTGVQRALLKPMEETDVELKVPHDPISMLQEIEQFQKTGKRDKRMVNTGNILFIVSGAFSELPPIIKQRVNRQQIGFGAAIASSDENHHLLAHVRTEDLIAFGFESEFVGRLPVRTVFQHLSEADLFEILKSPNNPVILGKKLDFASYGIDLKFDDQALSRIARNAFEENTGARGLVSAVEAVLLPFENRLPSSSVSRLAVIPDLIDEPERMLQSLLEPDHREDWKKVYHQIAQKENEYIQDYIENHWQRLSLKGNLAMSPFRCKMIANYYCKTITNLEVAFNKIKSYYDQVKQIELYFFNKHDINIILEEDAIDFIIAQMINSSVPFEDIFEKLSSDFVDGLQLVRQQTDSNRFFITREALLNPETFITNLITIEDNIQDTFNTFYHSRKENDER
jgi:endopeptidase Clp ATP-binding regulatory subunit ClpX